MSTHIYIIQATKPSYTNEQKAGDKHIRTISKSITSAFPSSIHIISTVLHIRVNKRRCSWKYGISTSAHEVLKIIYFPVQGGSSCSVVSIWTLLFSVISSSFSLLSRKAEQSTPRFLSLLEPGGSSDRVSVSPSQYNTSFSFSHNSQTAVESSQL